jgi:hypothetical protein
MCRDKTGQLPFFTKSILWSQRPIVSQLKVFAFFNAALFYSNSKYQTRKQRWVPPNRKKRGGWRVWFPCSLVAAFLPMLVGGCFPSHAGRSFHAACFAVGTALPSMPPAIAAGTALPSMPNAVAFGTILSQAGIVASST